MFPCRDVFGQSSKLVPKHRFLSPSPWGTFETHFIRSTRRSRPKNQKCQMTSQNTTVELKTHSNIIRPILSSQTKKKQWGDDTEAPKAPKRRRRIIWGPRPQWGILCPPGNSITDYPTVIRHTDIKCHHHYDNTLFSHLSHELRTTRAVSISPCPKRS